TPRTRMSVLKILPTNSKPKFYQFNKNKKRQISTHVTYHTVPLYLVQKPYKLNNLSSHATKRLMHLLVYNSVMMIASLN
ncbi:hypothetical protein, partial [Candidatus Ichthyocystis sparus]|uniref:hypothetical protein n=1 Tax=Candidatus Ichthyocystis sparus TaxID=1561004 RepID=UPI001F5E6C06